VGVVVGGFDGGDVGGEGGIDGLLYGGLGEQRGGEEEQESQAMEGHGSDLSIAWGESQELCPARAAVAS
jgi:hypothetical protein